MYVLRDLHARTTLVISSGVTLSRSLMSCTAHTSWFSPKSYSSLFIQSSAVQCVVVCCGEEVLCDKLPDTRRHMDTGVE